MRSYTRQKRWKTAHKHGSTLRSILSANQTLRLLRKGSMTCMRPLSQPQTQKDKLDSPNPNLDENMIAHLGLRLFIVAITINLKRNGEMKDLASGPTPIKNGMRAAGVRNIRIRKVEDDVLPFTRRLGPLRERPKRTTYQSICSLTRD